MFKKLTTLLLIGSIALSLGLTSCGGDENDKKIKELEKKVVIIEKASKDGSDEAFRTAYSTFKEAIVLSMSIDRDTLTDKQKTKLESIIKRGEDAMNRKN